MPERALILAPLGRDAALAQTILASANITSEIVGSFAKLLERLKTEAGFAVVTEESILRADLAHFVRWRESQPEWSDFPFILITARGGVERNPAAGRYLEIFGNVTFVERPFHPTTLLALAQAALRGRRKQYEARARLEALHRSEERFRAAVDAVQGVLWTNNADGRMEGEQPGWAALTGQTFEEYQGYGWAEAVHPDDAQPTIDAWQDAIARRGLFAFEHRVRAGDGQWRIFSIRAIPTFAIDGTLREWVGVHTDVTARRHAETALKELNTNLEERVAAALAERKTFADIVETTDSFVQVADMEFRWLAINRASTDEFERIFGIRPKVGESMLEVLQPFPEQQAEVCAVWARALAGEEFTLTETYGNPDRDRRTYEMKFNILKDSNGKQIGAFQVVTDVTQRIEDATRLAQTEDALRQAQKMEAIGQLTGGVAHDFNNLLTVIRGGAEFLKRSDNISEKQRVFVDAIFEASDRAAKLTQQLLAFSRRQPLRPEIFDLGIRVEKTSEMLRLMVGSRINIQTELEEELYVSADVAQFETAIVNLCVNARDAMQGEGVLKIRAFRNEGQICVAVEDQGRGIDPTILPKLFEPFFTTKAVGEGTGLGLSQVYGFARQSGGDIAVASTVNVGTCFTLSLPPAEAKPNTSTEHFIIKSPSKVRRILLVEDNDRLLHFAFQSLTELGHTVFTASSADEALQLIKQQPDDFDVVFTDVVMPGMSGLELARMIKVNWPEIVVVLASGYSDALANEEGLEFTLLSKPYGIEQLATVF